VSKKRAVPSFWVIFDRMQSRFFKISSFFLASWILLSSIGMSIDVHFCNGQIFSIGLNAAASNCQGSDADSDQPEHAVQKKSCCDYESSYCQKGIDSLSQHMTLDFKWECIAEFPFNQLEVEQISSNIFPAKNSSPPDERSVDRGILFSIFRV
jgi:hypothetical protein